jgi:hypothetical protein
VYKRCFDVINMSINRVSKIFSLPHSAINGLQCDILPKWMYWSALLRTRQMTRLLPHHNNDSQQFLDVSHEKSRALWVDSNSHLNNRPPFTATMLATTLLLWPDIVSQRSFNNFWPCIIEKTMAVWQHWSVIELSVVFLGKNCCNNIDTISLW